MVVLMAQERTVKESFSSYNSFVAAVSLVNRNSGMVIADNFSAFALPFLSIPLTERSLVVKLIKAQ